MNPNFLLILKNCDILPTNKEQHFLTFKDALNLSSCSKILRIQIESLYKLLFKNHYRNLKDLNSTYCYGTWLNFFRKFKEILIRDEILQLIDLNLTEDIIYIPIFLMTNCETYHVIRYGLFDKKFTLYPGISSNQFINYTKGRKEDKNLMNKLNSLEKIKTKSSIDFVQQGFFPLSKDKLSFVIDQLLDTSHKNIDKIILLIYSINFYNLNFSVEDLAKQFKENHLNENCDQDFIVIIMKYMRNLCKLYMKEFSIETVFKIYRHFCSLELYSKII